MPFLADIFFSAARNLNVTWYAEQTDTLCLFASIWQKLGFTGKLMVDDSVFKKGLRRANVHFVPKATALAEADVFVFDFRSAVRGSLPSKGLNRGPDPSKDLRVMFAHVVKYERERNIAGKRSRRIISLNAINNRFENFVRQRVAIAYSPFSGRMRHGFTLPASRGEEDWLPFLTPGEAGIREGKSIKSINRKLGVLAFAIGRDLESGTYRLVVGIDALSEDRQQWTDLPCVLIYVACGSKVIARRALSGKDLDNPELNFIFDVSHDIEDSFGSVELHFRLLAPLAVALQKLTIEQLPSNDELRKVAASNSAFGLSPGTVLDCRSNGNGMAYQADGWSLPEEAGTWTNGPRASLAARLVDWPADGMILQIAAHPFLVKGRHPSLAVEVLANGVVVDRWSYRYPGDNARVIRSARIPASLLAASPVLKIELQIDHPAVPSAMGISTDDRQLGLFVSSVSFLSERDRLQQAGAVVTPGTFVNFRPNGRGAAYQAEGWSLPEEAGTWTNGPQASLAARLVEWPADDMILQIAAYPFLVKDRHPSLAVEVLANGVVVDRWSYRYPGDNARVIRSARIPASLLAASPVLKIELQIDQPVVPMAMGISTDDRQLGLFVSSVSFLSERDRLQQAGAVVTPGTFVDFRPNGRGAAYQAEGWSLPEEAGTWTNGLRASLAARLVEWPADGMILQIAAHPFLVKGRHPSLAVEVLVNGVVVDRWSYRYPRDNARVIRSARIPASLLAASPVLKIELQIDQPVVPMAMGISTDDRQLGLFVSSVSFITGRSGGALIRSWFSSEMSTIKRAGTAIRKFKDTASPRV
jgi:hypothetical protein